MSSERSLSQLIREIVVVRDEDREVFPLILDDLDSLAPEEFREPAGMQVGDIYLGMLNDVEKIAWHVIVGLNTLKLRERGKFLSGEDNQKKVAAVERHVVLHHYATECRVALQKLFIARLEIDDVQVTEWDIRAEDIIVLLPQKQSVTILDPSEGSEVFFLG